MTHISKKARRSAFAALAAGATALSGVALLGPGTASASSHREAPYTAGDPAIDNTDVYAYVSPDKPDTVTINTNWDPFEEPGGGPNFYPWANDAAYDINIDNNGDAKPDITYRWTFTDVDKRGTVQHGDKVGGSFLYNDGPVTSLTDDNLLFRQTYDLNQITYNADGTQAASTPLLTGAPVVPDSIGASTPNYASLRTAGVAAGQIANGSGGQSYVGQAADSFFLDLRVFDLLYGGNFGEVGFDTLKNYNVNNISIQVPKTLLAANKDAKANPVIGVWSTSSRYATRTLKGTNEAPANGDTGTKGEATSSGNLVQVSRLGNPLVNEVVVPANLKDYFNRSTPDKDGQFIGKVQDPELPYLIQSIYKVPNPNGTPHGANRPDLVAAFLTGISKSVSSGAAYGGAGKYSPNVDLNSLSLNAVASTVTQAPGEYERLNMGIAPTAKPNRLGVIGGDVAGFPNGRRLTDDVVDIELAAVEGVLVDDQDATTKAAVAKLGDGVNTSPVPFLSTFPYVSDPYSGGAPHVGQVPVNFNQSFASGPGYIDAKVGNISPLQPGGMAQLYTIDPGNKLHMLKQEPLTAGGNAAATVRVKERAGATVTFYWRVIPATGNASANSGSPTTVTVQK